MPGKMAPFEWTWPNMSLLSRVFFLFVDCERVCFHWSVIQCKMKAINRSLRKTSTKNMIFFFISYLLLTIRFSDASSNGFNAMNKWIEPSLVLTKHQHWLCSAVDIYTSSLTDSHTCDPLFYRIHSTKINIVHSLENLKITWGISNFVLSQQCRGYFVIMQRIRVSDWAQ